ncbi:probable G-protein coupled receptor Mth-like 10 isoform X1 [Drosophila innubila]|uniref:probable G-protein coupled receptor Mth-like 10 isoform X1 n=1 Tax=Drosophila innubila TaxID=198719 RepID=UPI00148D0959|nr:probable G-protein coupled receptor Mth-like 10 isoform X1 [Drosophila innubila]
MQKKIHHKSGSLYCGVTLIGVVFLVIFRLLPGTSFGVHALGEEVNYRERNGIHTKCSFFDTVNVTGFPSFPNGSYSYEGVMIPSHYVGTFDYIYTDLVDRVDVAPHTRACICKLKPCINICCPWGQIFNTTECQKDTSTDHVWPEPVINITLKDGSIQNVNMYEKFVVQSFRPCSEMFSLIPQLNYYDTYKIFENGTLLREDDEQYMSKNEYCMVPTFVNRTDLYYIINPANCDMLNENTTVKIINGFAMLFSIPFMLLTIAVYLLIPELRNQHGKSLVCYLLGLTFGYILLCCVLLVQNLDPEGPSCKIFGYTAYFFFMSAFFWLNVISFDLWHNFRGTRGINRFQEKKRFLLYSLYSWGSALIFLIFTFLVQEYSDWPVSLKPGIGGGLFCWLDMTNWSAMLYFFGPILIIIVANTVMFVMTAFKIHGVQREMARIIAREDSTKNLRTEKDNNPLRFGLFLRLFLIMGVTWSSEIISYFVGSDKKWSKIFYVSDLCNAMQGFLIFMLFVLKKKVKHLISNRLLSVSLTLKNRNNNTNTNTNTIPIPIPTTIPNTKSQNINPTTLKSTI